MVVSHFILDGLVHVAGLPILGESSPKLGLGLWRNMPVELALETLLTLGCVVLYLRFIGPGADGALRDSHLHAAAHGRDLEPSCGHHAAFAAQLIPGWIGMPVIFGVLVYALDRRRARAAYE